VHVTIVIRQADLVADAPVGLDVDVQGVPVQGAADQEQPLGTPFSEHVFTVTPPARVVADTPGIVR
jgi:hypothetical protein